MVVTCAQKSCWRWIEAHRQVKSHRGNVHLSQKNTVFNSFYFSFVRHKKNRSISVLWRLNSVRNQTNNKLTLGLITAQSNLSGLSTLLCLLLIGNTFERVSFYPRIIFEMPMVTWFLGFVDNGIIARLKLYH